MLRYFKYQLPFKVPFSTSSETLVQREGVILVFEHESITAFGEIAPLPGFSKFDLDQILPILKLNKKPFQHALIQSDGEQFLHILNQIHAIPSLIFGLNTLLLDFKAKQAQQSLGYFLCEKPIRAVPCNAVLGISTIEQTIEKANKLVSQGFNTLKLKVGSNLAKELEILEYLRQAFPTIRIRLDANQGWAVKEAIHALNKFSNYDIEYCEQPIRKENILELAEVRKNTDIKIAADEACRNKEDVQELLELNAVDLLIIKPMMFGSFTDLNVTKKLADSPNTDIIFTTSLENKIGRTITAILASCWGSKNYAHGLSTASLFNEENSILNEVVDGHFVLNDSPGLGISIDYNNLREII